MPKQFYCSICGVELIYSRKAVPGKGRILDLIAPHECEGYAIKSDGFGKETVLDVLDNLKDLIKVVEEVSEERPSGFRLDEGDKRDDKDKRSTAPKSLLDNIKNMPNSTPEGDLG